MKIGDQPPAASDSQVSTNDPDSSQKKDSDNSEPSAFSRLLSKKRDPNQDGSLSQGGKPLGGPVDPSALGLVQAPPQPFGQLVQAVAPVESARPVAVPVELQQLVHEISVGVNSAGNQEVNIELNSNVLKGLNIKIERQQGAVAIQFQSSSEQVSALLSTNMNVLSQGLADRGVNVSDIRITTPSESGRLSDYKNPNRGGSGGRGQDGRQRGGR